MIVRELLAKFGVAFDDTGARKADAAIGGLKSGLQSLIGLVGGAALVRGFGNFLVQQVQLADAVGGAAERLGVGVEALQELRFAGQDAGLSLEGVDAALGKLVRGSSEAARGQGEAKDAFKELGVTLTDGQGNLLGFDAILSQVADGMGGAMTEADRLRLGYALFGREGSKFAATLKNGSAGLEELRQRARELGGVLSQEEVDAADKADKALAGFGLAVQGVKNRITAEFIPALTAGVGKMTRWVVGIQSIVRDSNILIGVAGAVGVALATMIGASRLLMLTKAGIAFGIIALAIDELKTWSEGGNTLIGRLIDKFNGLGANATVLESWKVGLKIMAETTERWLTNLQTGFAIMRENDKREAAKKAAQNETNRRAQFEREHQQWERRKKFVEENPWLPESLRGVPAEPVFKPAGQKSAFDELRTRPVSQVRGKGYGPLLPEVAGQSAEDMAREQYRQAEAVRVAGERAAAGGPVNVNQTVNVHVEGGPDAQKMAAMIRDKTREALIEQNAETFRTTGRMVP